MRGSTYSGKLQVTFRFWLNGVMQDVLDISVGEIPIMLKVRSLNTPDDCFKLIVIPDQIMQFGGTITG